MSETVYIELPASKSISNRLLVLKHLYFPDLHIAGLSEAADTSRMRSLLEEGALPEHIDVADAGTVARFITALAALDGQSHYISGSERMHERPMQDLIDALRSLGAHLRCTEKEGFLPLGVSPTALKGGSVSIETSQSSQFVSAMMMIGPALPIGLEIRLLGRKSSWPYIEMTARLMQNLGLRLEMSRDAIYMAPSEKRKSLSLNIEVERDWSSAAFFWVAAALMPDDVKLIFPGLSAPDNSIQGDAILAGFTEMLGLELFHFPHGLGLQKTATKPDVSDELNFEFCPDLALPVVSGLCALRKSFLVTGVHSLNAKESPRMDVLLEMMKVCSVRISRVNEVSFTFDASEFQLPANHVFKTYDDHRVAMSLGVLGLLGEVIMDNKDCVRKSFPGFWEELDKLRVNAH